MVISWHRLNKRLRHYLYHPNAGFALMVLSFAEATVFPIPAFLWLLPLCASQPNNSQRFLKLAFAASVFGSIYGYAIGHFAHLFFNQSSSNWFNGVWLIDSMNQTGLLIVFLCCFLPLPFRVVAVAAGAASIGVVPFVLVAALGRGLQFLLLSQLLRYFSLKIFSTTSNSARHQ